jgi:hypothetical protein
VAKHRALKRVSVTETARVYRIVRVESTSVGIDVLVGEFAAAPDCAPTGRERKYPILQEGISVFRTDELARQRWRAMRSYANHHGEADVARGSFIAQLELKTDCGFFLEDLGASDGHLTMWGDATKLAEAVRRIDPAGIADKEGS